MESSPAPQPPRTPAPPSPSSSTIPMPPKFEDEKPPGSDGENPLDFPQFQLVSCLASVIFGWSSTWDTERMFTAACGGLTRIHAYQSIGHPGYRIFNSMEYIEKCRKYEEDYSCRLITKYFSDKNLHGVDVYDEKITIEDELILSSRWPCTRSFVEPLKPSERQETSGSPTSDS